MGCPTGKRRFTTKVDAMLVIARAQRKQKLNKHTNRLEQRYYHCRKCKGWHTTSQPRDS